MTYNEYWQVIDAGIPESELVVFKYEDQGVATLEDGLYTLDAKLKDPKMVDKLARFVKASMKGWDYAVKNQDEAVAIVLDNDASGAQTEKHQKQMISEIAKLLENGTKPGYLDPAAYERKSDPVISKKPEGAWTHAVWEKAGF
jgi:NitT/TauT family transport system substrate-binding protein